MVEHDAEPTNEEGAFASFCLLLGRFFHAYTALEYEMSLAVYAAVLFGRPKDDVLLAVLGGQRMSALKDTLNRLMRATKATPKRQSLIKTMFQQLGEVQFFRDKLAHNFTSITPHEDIWVNMNFGAIREREKMEDIYFHLAALDHATHDMAKMRDAIGPLFSHCNPNERTRLPTLPTWRFKPSMLARHRPLSRGDRKRPKRRPQS